MSESLPGNPNKKISTQNFKLPAGSTTIACQLKMIPAIILHPSLGTPLVHEPGKTISLFVVTDKTFFTEFVKGNGGQKHQYAAGAENIADLIVQHLKILKWDQATQLKKDLSQADTALLTDIVDKTNIQTTYLGELSSELRNSQGKHFANVRESLRTTFVGFRQDGKKIGWLEKYFSNDGIRHLFQVDLVDAQLSPNTMYDSFWLISNVNSQDDDVQKSYLDIQDRIARDYIRENYYEYLDEKGPDCAFMVSEEGLDFSTLDSNTPIQIRHPIYVAPCGKRKLNIGHLTDVHVSSKQYTYKHIQANVIPDVDASVSPPIGPMANNNLDNYFDLLTQFGSDSAIDAVVITGDLYDHLHNYDPNQLTDSRTGKLWEAMYVDSVDGVRARNKDFPRGIDGLLVYSLLCYFYKTYKKPVFITTGNHEAYEYPYGISPRIGPFRPNDGIPLDHNLTIYEAILLYGPGYSKLIPFPKKSDGIKSLRLNFKAKNFDWFYTLFTPLTDYAVPFADQCMIGFGWGDGEDYLLNWSPLTISSGGTLPRATKSPSSSQIDLKNDFVAGHMASAGQTNILFSHFTQANYALDTPITDRGEINCNDNAKEYGSYDHGSTKIGRSVMYGEWLHKRHFDFTLSGHSHRAGLYRCVEYNDSRSGMDSLVFRKNMIVVGGHPEKEDILQPQWRDRTKMLVSASTGPLSKQNIKGEMSSFGMESPSGSRLELDGREKITLVTSRKSSAKPRFCVACDYIDILKDGFWEYFKAVGSDGTFEMKPFWEKIHPTLKENEMRPLIESVMLYLVEGDQTKPVAGRPIFDSNVVKIVFPNTLKKQISKDYSKGAFFLSIKFNGKAVGHLPGFMDYDYDSPWNIQVGIYGANGSDIAEQKTVREGSTPMSVGGAVTAAKLKKQGVAANDPSRWQIMRHKKYGEIPYFDWRAETMPSEFKYALKKSEK